MRHSITELNQRELKAIVGGNQEMTVMQALGGMAGTVLGMLAYEYIFSPAIDALEKWWKTGSKNTQIPRVEDNETAKSFLLITSVII